MKVKAELEKVWKITGRGDSKNISKPVEQTLKAFIEGRDEYGSEGCNYKYGTFTFAINVAPGDFL